MGNSNREEPVIRIISKLTDSALYLTAAIGFSAYVLLNLLGRIVGSSYLQTVMNIVMNNSMNYNMDYGMAYELYNWYSGAMRMINISLTVLAMIPVILFTIGLWLFYAEIKNKNHLWIQGKGLAMIRVIMTVNLVLTCIKLGAMELFCLFPLAMAKGETVVIVIILFSMLIWGLIGWIQILFYLRAGRIINTIRNTIQYMTPDANISSYVEIMCYIMGAMWAISALTSVVFGGFFILLANAGKATGLIAVGIFLRSYRNDMQRMITNPGMMGMSAALGQGARQQVYQQPVQQQPVWQQPVQQQPVQQQPVQQQPVQQQPVQQQPVQQQSVYQPLQEENFYNPTSVLNQQAVIGEGQKLVRLTRKRTGETIFISKPTFWIGKDMTTVDYCISGNAAVSRRHVMLSIQDGRPYVRDNHSTNHSYVNNHMIQADENVPLSDGDCLRLGDEEFIVNL